MSNPIRLPGLAVLIVLILASAVVAQERPTRARPTRTIVVADTLETALGQPLVHVQLRDGDRVLTAEPDPMSSLLGGDDRRVATFPAYLDTGSSSVVLSRATASRFGVETVPEAVYLEVGLHGDHPMAVSRPYALGVASFSSPDEQPVEPTTALRRAAFQINDAGDAPGLLRATGSLDVVGMPVIRTLVVEIDPTGMHLRPGGGLLEALENLVQTPVVRLHRRGPRDVDVIVPLEPADFTRRGHPGHRGPKPALADNPMVTVTLEHGGRRVTGSWLLDTGAAASVMSSDTARQLGLLDDAGAPAGEVDFELPLGGISGRIDTARGFKVDSLELPARSRTVLVFPEARVVVRDIAIEPEPGESRRLDGVLGMNLLFPSAEGLSDGVPDKTTRPPFRRVWIDGPRSRLALELNDS